MAQGDLRRKTGDQYTARLLESILCNNKPVVNSKIRMVDIFFWGINFCGSHKNFKI